MELTGERPVRGATPDSLLALHDAGYREVAARLSAGTVVDVGCGFAEQTARLGGRERFVLGIDYDVGSVQAASRPERPSRMRFAAMQGDRLGLRHRSVDSIVSSHVIEHFTNPVPHVAELARVLHSDGTAFVITPNAPADFENPFHVYPFEPPELVSLLSLFFEEVECLGLEADDALRSDFAARRASGARLLALDVLRLRHRIPRRWYVWSYERALPVVYRLLGSRTTGIGSGLDDSHLHVTDEITPATPVLFATARGPRPRRDGR